MTRLPPTHSSGWRALRFGALACAAALTLHADPPPAPIPEDPRDASRREAWASVNS